MTKISTDISNLTTDVKAMKLDIARIKAAINNMKKINTKNIDFIATVPQLSKKYNYNIPFKTMEEFKTFNNHLSEKNDLRESVVLYRILLLFDYKIFSDS